MNKSRAILVIGVLLITIIMSFAGMALVSAQPKIPQAFSGDLIIKGPDDLEVPAPIGTEVVAKVGGEVRGRLTTIEEGAYGDVDDITVPDLYVGTEHYIEKNATIEFYTNGIVADQTATFESGADTKLDLTVYDAVNPEVTIDSVTTPTNVVIQTITGTFDEAFIDNITVNDILATIDEDAGIYSAADVPLVEGANTITVTATDLVGNAGTATATIVLDTIKPTISDISVSGITSTGATITWTTDEPATSVVEYGKTAAYDLEKRDTSLVTAHSITLAGLSASTTYHYRVKSADAAINLSVSADHTFTTAAPPTVPDFSISVSPTSGSVVRGESATTTVSLTPIAGFSKTVDLSVSGLPSGATENFSPSSGTPNFTSTLTISTASTTPIGTYSITIKGTGGGKTHSCTYTLTVTAVPVPDFSIGISPASGSVVQGKYTTATVSVSSIAEFDETVDLSASGLPSGATASFSIPSGTPSFDSTLTISTALTTPVGACTVTITGTDGGKTHSCTYTLTVTTVPVNQPPTADAGGPYSVDEGKTVKLDGTGSSDPDGDTLTYSWTITVDPTGESSLTNSNTATPTFHAPSVDSDTNVTVKLTVDDGHGHTDSDTATVTVKVVAPPPAEFPWPAVLAIIIIVIVIVAICYWKSEQISRRLRRV